VKLFLALLLFPIQALAFNALTVYGTTEDNQPLRLQYATDMQVDRFRLAGVANFDDHRYQIKPRITVDLFEISGFTFHGAYQREWFVVDGKRPVSLDIQRYGAGIRHKHGPVRHELNVYTERWEDFLTVQLAPKWSINNQFWNDFERNTWWNQLSLSYALTKNVAVVAQHASAANQQAILRGGVSWRF
jgi:hypothetical protein